MQKMSKILLLNCIAFFNVHDKRQARRASGGTGKFSAVLAVLGVVSESRG